MGRHARGVPNAEDLTVDRLSVDTPPNGATLAETPTDDTPTDDAPQAAAAPTTPQTPAVPGPAALLGWGLFATAVAVVVAALTGEGWPATLPTAGLGAGTTLVLWAAVRAAGTSGPATDAAGSYRRPRLRPQRPHRRAEPGHAAKSTLGRGVKYPRDKRKR